MRSSTGILIGLVFIGCALIALLQATECQAKTPAQRLVECVCRTHPRQAACIERRRADTRETAETIVLLARQAEAPPLAAAILVATTCGESAAKAHPRGSNDRGTSAGWFQIKRTGAHSRAFEKRYERPLDWHDLREAGAWYLERVRGALRGVRGVCGRVARPWAVAAARVAAGPWSVRPRKGKCVQAQALDGGPAHEICEPAVKGVQQCTARGYGRKALRWLRADGKAAWL